MSTPTVDHAAECREAFTYLALEHAAIAPRGYDSQRAREKKHQAIDKVLDDYLARVKP